jgi:hypothetical protein
MSNILQNWGEIKILIETLETDMGKTAGGNKAAGVRVRKGLRSLKGLTASLVKETLNKNEG